MIFFSFDHAFYVHKDVQLLLNLYNNPLSENEFYLYSCIKLNL